MLKFAKLYRYSFLNKFPFYSVATFYGDYVKKTNGLLSVISLIVLLFVYFPVISHISCVPIFCISTFKTNFIGNGVHHYQEKSKKKKPTKQTLQKPKENRNLNKKFMLLCIKAFTKDHYSFNVFIPD